VEEMVRAVTLEVWILFVAVLSLLAGAVGAWATVYYGRRSSRDQEEQRSLQQEQLRLQREIATMVPDLKVSDVRFLQPRSVWEVHATMREVEKAKQEAEEEQQRKERGEWYMPSSLDPALFDPRVQERRGYGGPEPGAVMEIELENAGRTAAHNVSGTISMKRDPLEILVFPGLDASEVSDPDEAGIVTAEVGTIPEILPGQRGSFRMAMVIRQEPKEAVTLKYDFITPAGFPTSGEWVVYGG
jgi:hypothetical protein